MINLFDYERNAQRLLSTPVWDTIAGGANDELTTRRNHTAFDDLRLKPRYLLRDIARRSLATTVLGTLISMPIMISPAGFHAWAHPDSEKATAQGAERAGTVLMVPSIARYMAMSQSLRGGNFPEGPADSSAEAEKRMTAADLPWIRSLTSLPLVAKGILTPEDAVVAVESGASAILVSNHGGRLLDGAISTIEALPPIVAAVGSRVEVYLDSGVRRGTDVLKALALGARAVSVGRPLFWGLAAGGGIGVAAMLDVLRDELDRAMAFCGATQPSEIERSLLHIPRDWGVSS